MKYSISDLGRKATLLATSIFVLTSSLSALVPAMTGAVVNSPTPEAKISFTFDDSLASAYTQAAPTLKKYGFTGTNYVITKCVGMTKAPNTCHANTAATYMTWAQIAALQSTYGWEIASHTATHPYLATKDAQDGQPNVLTAAQVQTELTQSKTDLAAHGINATDLSTPYGDYNNAVLAQIAKYYASQRGFADDNNNTWAYNDYLLYDMRVQSGVTVAQVKARIDQAIANKQWLVLTMHDIMTKPSTNPDDYQYATKDLDTIAAYVKTKQTAGLIRSINVNQGLVTSDTNLLANGSFDSGIASGWRTDSPTTIKADSANNGSYPSPTNSIKFASGASQGHLFSPIVNVNANTTYMLKNFLNLQTVTTGQVAFYVDEYDVNGNWVSGQYKKAENNAFVENINFPYTPTSANVAKASLQVIVSGTGISGFLDNSQWFALQTIAPTQANLMSDGNFENGLGTWTADSASITPDTANNGSSASPKGSVKLTSSSNTGHLFSPKIGVSSTKSYTLTNYLNLQTITSGEVAFYLDEYDVNGNWVSGQYKMGVHTVGATDISFTYTPTSTNVSTASLQVIVVSNSGITAYFDNSRWYTN